MSNFLFGEPALNHLAQQGIVASQQAVPEASNTVEPVEV